MAVRKFTLCTVAGCGKPHWCRGWCQMHYVRNKRHGDPNQGSRAALVKDMLGQRFGRLLVTARAGSNPAGTALWRCVCDCGTVIVTAGPNLRFGRSRSCGCLSLELSADRTRKHGLAHTKAYHAWHSMKSRCERLTDAGYKDYGGRGITICARWQSVLNFIADMGEPPPGMEIDRYPDNDGNYEPGNCRWATKLENMSNRRNSRIVEWRGQSMSIGRVARLEGLHRASLRRLVVLQGESVEDAVAQLRRSALR